MARGGSAKKKKNKNSASVSAESSGNQQDGFLWVDPAHVRFQHSRIRSYFSGCGRSVIETLDSIRRKEISASDIPPIQVIIGPDTNEGPTYFSLNNRRLWVFKRCREEGLLENNTIRVRVRSPKSSAEAARYSIENCALEAKIIKEKDKRDNDAIKKTGMTKDLHTTTKMESEQRGSSLGMEKNGTTTDNDGGLFRSGHQVRLDTRIADDREESSSDDSGSEDMVFANKNPFNALSS